MIYSKITKNYKINKKSIDIYKNILYNAMHRYAMYGICMHILIIDLHFVNQGANLIIGAFRLEILGGYYD